MKSHYYIFILCCFFFKTANSQTLKGVQRATSSNLFEYECFGYGMDYSGNTAIIGTFDIRWIGESLWVGRKPIPGGRAYILERNSNGVWIEKQTLHSPDKHDLDRFGEMGVAISGNYAVVSASHHNNGNPGDNSMKAAGAVYIYEKDASGKWSFLQKLVPHDRKSKANFGISVEIQGDCIFVGAINNHTDRYNKNFMKGAGAVYVFKKNENGKWLQFLKLTASDRSPMARFGFATSVSGDYLCVGAFGEDAVQNNSVIKKAGAAYIFKKDKNGIWNEVQKLVQDQRTGLSSFGSDVCLNKKQLIIGASSEHSWSDQRDSLRQTGAVYIYRLSEHGFWERTQKIQSENPDEYDNFGATVGITDERVLIGIPYDEVEKENKVYPNAGSVQFYEKDKDGLFKLTQRLISHDPEAGQRFGHYLMLSENFAGVAEHLDGARPVNTIAKNKTGVVFFYSIFPAADSSDSPTYELIDYVQPVNPDTTLLVDVPVVNDAPIDTPTDSAVVVPIDEGDPPVFLLTPNPSSGQIKIVILNYEKITYNIAVNIPYGKEVFHKKTSTKSTEIDLNRIPKGTYTVIVSSKFGESKQLLVLNQGNQLDPRNNNNGGGR